MRLAPERWLVKAAFPRGARAFRSERWLVKLATTIPRSRGSPPHLAPRVWGRRAGCAVSWSSGCPAGTRRDVSPAAVGAVGRASVYVLFRVFFFYGALLFVYSYTIVPSAGGASYVSSNLETSMSHVVN